MKIAYVTQPWDGIGMGSSIGIITCKTISELAAEHQITIYAKNGKCGNTDSGNVNYKHIPLKYDKLFLKLIKLLSKFNIIGSKKKPVFCLTIFYFFYAFFAARDIKKNNIEVVHIHNYSQFVSVIRFFNPKAKIVLHMHCEWLSQLDKNLIGTRIAKTDAVISVSDYITNKIKTRFPQFLQKCFTLENGVDINEYKSISGVKPGEENKKLKILFVGRVSPEKGVHVLFSAFNIIADKYPNVELDIVGPVKSAPVEFIINLSDEPEIQKLKKFYGEEKYSDQLMNILSDQNKNKVKFIGQVNSDRLKEFYNSSNILINSSFSESFGMSLIEAMSSETPVIAARIGGMVELVEKSNAGFLFEAGNVEELADKIEQVILDDELRKTFSGNGRIFVEKNYSWSSITKRLEVIYQNA